MSKNWAKLTDEEKRDLNMISKAYFDLFLGAQIRLTKYQMMKWIRDFQANEQQNNPKL